MSEMANTTKAILDFFVEKNASDLYLTVGAPPCIRLHSVLERYPFDPLTEQEIQVIMKDLVSEKGLAEFRNSFEFNSAITWEETRRFRINLFRQKQSTGIVIRRVQTEIPTIDSLLLPKIYGELIMEKRGLILVVGQPGSGKSSTLAAMIGHRNRHGSGHIITIEDPIEFEHTHENCIITQRDVGTDTMSYGSALKNALRQMPDVIVIGEVRDADTMENAMAFAETGQLCIATLHANNANQAIERVVNFFPEEKRKQVLMSLSLNLRAIISQRLVRNVMNTRSLASEVMLNIGQIRDLILAGNIKEMREHIERGTSSGMQIFEQALLRLYEDEIITEEMALAEADSPANLRMAMRQHSVSKFKAALDAPRQKDGPDYSQY